MSDVEGGSQPDPLREGLEDRLRSLIAAEEAHTESIHPVVLVEELRALLSGQETEGRCNSGHVLVEGKHHWPQDLGDHSADDPFGQATEGQQDGAS